MYAFTNMIVAKYEILSYFIIINNILFINRKTMTD